MPRSTAPLVLLANEILDQILEALYPAGFFSNPDWMVDYVAEREERGKKKKEREELEEEEKRKVEESEMEDGVEDGEEEQPKDDSDSNRAIAPDYDEIGAWTRITEADSAVFNFGAAYLPLERHRKRILRQHAKLRLEARMKQAAVEADYLTWDQVRTPNRDRMLDASLPFPDTIEEWNQEWSELGHELRYDYEVPSDILRNEKDHIRQHLENAIQETEPWNRDSWREN